jgi:AcrR family transcriptional regulator
MSNERATKMLILSSARTLFSEKGYDETAVEEICSLAGVAKGTFFYYFESKQYIVRYILMMQLKDYCEKLKEQIDTFKDAVSRMEYFILVLIERNCDISETESYFKGRASEWFSDVIKEERMKAIYPLMEEIVYDGINEGMFRVKSPDICMPVIFLGLDSYLRKSTAEMEEIKDGVREITAKTLGLKDTAFIL